MYLALKPTRGVTALFGRDLVTVPRHELPELRRSIGVVFQDFRLIDHLTTLENVALPLRVGGARGDDVKKHVSDLLRWVGLGERMHAVPPVLSAAAAAPVKRPAPRCAGGGRAGAACRSGKAAPPIRGRTRGARTASK